MGVLQHFLAGDKIYISKTWQNLPLTAPPKQFFFPLKILGLLVSIFEKVPVILKKCPWQKTPNFARENWRVARDKITKKVPVRNEKCP